MKRKLGRVGVKPEPEKEIDEMLWPNGPPSRPLFKCTTCNDTGYLRVPARGPDEVDPCPRCYPTLAESTAPPVRVDFEIPDNLFVEPAVRSQIERAARAFGRVGFSTSDFANALSRLGMGALVEASVTVNESSRPIPTVGGGLPCMGCGHEYDFDLRADNVICARRGSVRASSIRSGCHLNRRDQVAGQQEPIHRFER